MGTRRAATAPHRSKARATRKTAARGVGPSIRTIAVIVLGLFAVAMAYILLVVHRTPLYGVETDLFGEYIPAARSLLAGHPVATQYEFKGPGYPLLLALSTIATFGDAWLAARLLNLLAALVAARFTFLLVRRTVGDAAACFVLAALCTNPLFVRTTIEAGTDVPTFALSMAATYFALTAKGPRGAAAAGFLAGVAILCRYNAAFLVPAGLLSLALARERSASRAQMAGAYLLGLAVPVVPWLVINHRLTGSAFSNRNYANLAFELYGREMLWDQFWEQVAPRFHSFADVVRYDPLGAFGHWIRNLGTRWASDVRQLVPLWMGVAAVLGGLLHFRRAPKRAGLLIHFVFCYATLALVFYAPRFFLYLVPFYLIGAALAFFPRGRRAEGPGRWRVIAATAAVLTSGAVSAQQTAALLRDPPWEIVEAGRILRAVSRPGDRVLARKPQVAYFANMAYEPIPQVQTLRKLLSAARGARAGYLTLSGVEAALVPQFHVLNSPNVHLPGFTLLASETADLDHFFALYRIEPAGPTDTAFVDSIRAALSRLSERNSDNSQAQTYAGVMLMEEGQIPEALTYLDRAVALDPRAAQPRAYRASVLLELGRLDEAARDCEKVIATTARAPAAFHLLLGYIRVRQGRLADAQSSFEDATRQEPANVSAQLVLGCILLAQGKSQAGQAAIDRAVRLAPELAPLRDVALQRAATGDVAGVERLIDLTRRTVDGSGSMESMVDSARAGRG